MKYISLVSVRIVNPVLAFPLKDIQRQIHVDPLAAYQYLQSIEGEIESQ